LDEELVTIGPVGVDDERNSNRRRPMGAKENLALIEQLQQAA
jgi:hypothetical protein